MGATTRGSGATPLAAGYLATGFAAGNAAGNLAPRNLRPPAELISPIDLLLNRWPDRKEDNGRAVPALVWRYRPGRLICYAMGRVNSNCSECPAALWAYSLSGVRSGVPPAVLPAIGLLGIPVNIELITPRLALYRYSVTLPLAGYLPRVRGY